MLDLYYTHGLLIPRNQGGGLLAAWDFTDPARLRQVSFLGPVRFSPGVFAVEDDGDPVGWVEDLSGSGWHLGAGTTGQRPLWDETAGCVYFDEAAGPHWLVTPQFGMAQFRRGIVVRIRFQLDNGQLGAGNDNMQNPFGGRAGSTSPRPTLAELTVSGTGTTFFRLHDGGSSEILSGQVANLPAGPTGWQDIVFSFSPRNPAGSGSIDLACEVNGGPPSMLTTPQTANWSLLTDAATQFGVGRSETNQFTTRNITGHISHLEIYRL